MSETVTLPDNAAATGGNFLSGGSAEAQTTQAATPTGYFRDDYQKDGSLKEGWSERFKEQGLERLANTGMKYKSEADFWKGIDHSLGLIGKRAAAGYPQGDWSPNDISEFRRNAGVPEKAEDYKLIPDKPIPGVEYSKEKAQELANWAHSHHVPQMAMDKLMELHLGSVKGNVAAQEAAIQQRITENLMATRKELGAEWGDEFSSRSEAYDFFLQSQGIDPKADPMMAIALSSPKMVRIVDMARRSLKEGAIPGFGRENGGTGGSASNRQALEELAKDPTRFSDPSKSERYRTLAALVELESKKGR